MDLFEKIKNNRGPLGQYAKIAEGYWVFPKLTGEIGGRMTFMGKEVICWSVNNYLGMANHPEIRKVDADAAAEWGMAYPMGARLMTGETDEHLALEKTLANFVGKPAGAMLNFGYQGIMSSIDSLVGRNDVIVYDKESHGCIIDGVRLHPGKRFVYEHNDMASFEKNMERATKWVEGTGGGILVISEGVFGMRGDQGKLKEIVEFKKKFNFRFLVDDAHGFGVLGPNGEGAGVEQGCMDGIDVYFATFAKSFASIGAFLAGDPDVMEYLKYNMRSQIFAKSLPMPIVIGIKKRFELMQKNPELKANLWNIVNKLQNGLRERGFNIGDVQSCVTPVFLDGTPYEASQLVYDMRENYGVFCSMVVFPMIPKGTIILRMIPTAAHTEQDVEDTLNAFTEVSKKLKAGEYKDEVPELSPELKQ